MSRKPRNTAAREDGKPALVPKLRFPEFENDGEWESKALGDVVKSFKTGKLDANAMVENGQYRFYTCAKDFYQIDHYAFDGEALLIAGNGHHLGYIHHYVGQFNAYQRTYVLQKFDANVVFLRCLLERYLPYRIQLEKKDGNTPYIVLTTLTEMPLVIPQEALEQQKIADCLSSLDELIAAQARKVEALKTHKKGLMQQLFPREGETQPRLRFPEFRGDAEWEVRKLKYLATYTKGFAFKSQDYSNKGIRIIRVSDLGADFIKTDNEKIYIDARAAKLYERYKLREEEIIITTVGSKPELVDSAVGRGVRVTKSNEGLLNQNLLKLEVLPGTSSMFLFCNINTAFYQEFIVSISRGNANQANIAVKELMGFEVTLPSLPEQQRIADCLSSLYTLITAETQKLETLKRHKRGLMQQLFPSPEEAEA